MIAARIAITAITVKSSIRVKPFRDRVIICLPHLFLWLRLKLDARSPILVVNSGTGVRHFILISTLSPWRFLIASTADISGRAACLRSQGEIGYQERGKAFREDYRVPSGEGR